MSSSVSKMDDCVVSLEEVFMNTSLVLKCPECLASITFVNIFFHF